MARPKDRVKDPDNLSNLKRNANGKIIFSSETLYQYEIDRAHGRMGPARELRMIGLCLEQHPTRRERGRLLYRVRKIAGQLPTPNQSKIMRYLSKMGARINKYERDLREEGIL